MFENYHTLPQAVQNELLDFNDEAEAYAECERLLENLAPLGYTFSYGLDGIPYELRKLPN